MILAAWFHQPEESFSYDVVWCKKVCPPVKINCPPAEKINETPGYITRQEK